MNKWLQDIKIKNNKKAMPVLTFPAIQLLNKSVSELINDSHLQVEALKIITERCDPLAVLGFMDLSVEAHRRKVHAPRHSAQRRPLRTRIILHQPRAQELRICRGAGLHREHHGCGQRAIRLRTPRRA